MYKKIRIEDFINFTSDKDKDKYKNVIQGNIGWVNIDVNRSKNYLDKICNFDRTEISEIKKLNIESNNYSLDLDKDSIIIIDKDFSRETINNSLP